jgi:hypothetical protein
MSCTPVKRTNAAPDGGCGRWFHGGDWQGITVVDESSHDHVSALLAGSSTPPRVAVVCARFLLAIGHPVRTRRTDGYRITGLAEKEHADG